MKQIEWGYFDNPNRDFCFSQTQQNYYNSERWAILRERRLKIDDYRCAECGSIKNLQVHHKHGLLMDDPEEDLITLCKSCHEMYHVLYDKQKALNEEYYNWHYEKLRERREAIAESFVKKYIHNDILYGGSENLCNIKLIKKYYDIDLPSTTAGTIQQIIIGMKYHESHKYFMSGYNKNQTSKIVGFSTKGINSAHELYVGIRTDDYYGREEFDMKKIDMTNVQESGEFRRPTAGAYICKITDVEDVADREYLKIFYDIDAGEYKGYYSELRSAHPDWFWCGAYVRSYKTTALGMLKRFCTAVSKSNGNYIFDAGATNSDESTLIGKKLGIVFQEEEYYGNDGNKRTRLIVNKEFPVDKLADQKVPEPKLLPVRTMEQSDFQTLNVSEGTDEEVPF